MVRASGRRRVQVWGLALALLFALPLAVAAAQQDKSKPAVETDAQWTRRVGKRLNGLDPATDLAADERFKDVVDQLRKQPWRGASAITRWLTTATAWMTRTEGDAEENALKAKALIGWAQMVARVADTENGPEGLRAIVRRVAAWSPADHRRYRTVTESTRPSPSDAQLASAVKAVRELGRTDFLGHAETLRGSAAFARGQFDKAVTHFRAASAALKNVLSFEDALLAECNLGIMQMQARDHQGAIETLTKTLAFAEKLDRAGADPGIKGNTQLALADVYADIAEHEKAIALYRQALSGLERSRSLRGQVARAAFHAGNSLLALRRDAEAIPLYEKAIERRKQQPSGPDLSGIRTNLGLVLGHVGRFEESIAQHERALKLRRSDTPVRQADALNKLANAYHAAGRPEAARRAAQRALATATRANAAKEKTYAQLNLANALAGSGDVEAALGGYRTVLGAGRRYLTRDHVARCLSNFATLLESHGRYDESLRVATRAVSAAKANGVPHVLAQAQNVYGAALLGLGRYTECVAHYEALLTEVRTLGEPTLVDSILNNVANAYLSLGQPGRGLRCVEEALASYRARKRKDDVFLAALLSSLGSFQSDLLQFERAKATFTEVVAIRERLRDPAKHAAALINLAHCCMERKELKEASAHYRVATTLLEKAGNRHIAGVIATSLGIMLYRNAQYAEAAEQLARATELRRRTGNDYETSISLAWEGLTLTQLGRREEALEKHREALSLRAESKSEDGTAEASFAFAEAAAAVGRDDEGRAAIADGLDNLGRYRSRIRADRERIAFTAHWTKWLHPTLRVCIGPDPSKPADPALTWRAFESIRGAATAARLRESIGEAERDPAADAPREARNLARHIAQLDREIQETEGVMSFAKKREQAKRRTRLRERQRALEKRWQDAVSRESWRSPMRQAQSQAARPITLDQLRAALGPDEAFVGYALSDEGSFALRVDHKGLAVYTLAAAPVIAKAVERVRAIVSATPANDAAIDRRPFRTLYDLVLGPLERAGDLNANRTWIVCPDGPLHGVPFQALMRPGSDATNEPPAYLVRTHTIAYAHSGTVWALAQKRRRARAPTGDRALIFGDVLGRGEVAAVHRSARRARLPHTRDEALRVLTTFIPEEKLNGAGWRGRTGERDLRPIDLDAVRASTPATRDVIIEGPTAELRLGRFAHKGALLAREGGLGAFRYVHFATHGYVDLEHPGLSGLSFSPRDGDSGVVRLLDLLGLELRADLVTLSACETQVGPATADGFQGLMRIVLHAGAHNVLATSWPVPDEETAALIPSVYETMRGEQVAPAHALARAQRAFLNRMIDTKPAACHPHCWAAWTVWGIGVR